MTDDADDLTRLYRVRFSAEDRVSRERVWEVSCREVFQQSVGERDTVLDIGCGYGEFVRHIRALRKIPVDINPAASRG